jgi:hypothetical protein
VADCWLRRDANTLIMQDRENAAGQTRDFLANMHAQHAIAPTRYADPRGAFVDSIVEGFFGDALPIVTDANVLRRNIARA